MARMALLMMLLAGLLYNALPVAALAHGAPVTTAAHMGGMQHDAGAHPGGGESCGKPCGAVVTHATCVACQALPAVAGPTLFPPPAAGRPADRPLPPLAGRMPPVLVPPPRG